MFYLQISGIELTWKELDFRLNYETEKNGVLWSVFYLNIETQKQKLLLPFLLDWYFSVVLYKMPFIIADDGFIWS